MSDDDTAALVPAPPTAPARPAESRQEAAATLLREIFSGQTRRVVVIGTREDARPGEIPSEPNLLGQDGLERGVWNPAARSVHQFEPAAAIEGDDAGDGAVVQGFSEQERRAAFRSFLGVRRALVEMTEAPDPASFVAKLREAAGHLGPDVSRALDAAVSRFVALPAPEDVVPELVAGDDED